jgi:hypothetical protein
MNLVHNAALPETTIAAALLGLERNPNNGRVGANDPAERTDRRSTNRS